LVPGPATDVGTTSARAPRGAPESAHAWVRLGAALALSAIGGVGMWSVIVALPAVQTEFGVARSAASLPYTHPVERAERLDRRRPLAPTALPLVQVA